MYQHGIERAEVCQNRHTPRENPPLEHSIGSLTFHVLSARLAVWNTCALPTLMSYNYLWDWEISCNSACWPDARQSTRAGAGKARVSRCIARTHKGPCKHNTRARRQGWCTKTNRLTNAQTMARYAHLGAEQAHTKVDMRCKHPGNGTVRVADAVPCHDCYACAMVMIMESLDLALCLGPTGTCASGTSSCTISCQSVLQCERVLRH